MDDVLLHPRAEAKKRKKTVEEVVEEIKNMPIPEEIRESVERSRDQYRKMFLDPMSSPEEKQGNYIRLIGNLADVCSGTLENCIKAITSPVPYEERQEILVEACGQLQMWLLIQGILSGLAEPNEEQE